MSEVSSPAEATGAGTEEEKKPTTEQLETAASAAKFDLAEALQKASKETERSPLSLSVDFAKAHLGKAKLSHDEFFRYRVYDPALTGDERAAFIGQRPSNILNNEINEAKKLRSVIDDKVLYAAMLRGLGMQSPALQGALWETGVEAAFPVYRDAESFADFLRKDANYPLFGKPRHGSESKGSASFDRYDAETDCLIDVQGESVSVADFAAEAMEKYGKGGYLVQDRVVPHEELQEVSGMAVGTVRVYTLNEGEGPKPRYAVWKIPAFNGVADNLWRAGNMIAEIDVETGEVLAVRRSGIDGQSTVDVHPESNAQLRGRKLPDWDAAMKLVTRAATLTTEVLGIGFDLALSDKGPLIIEANTRPAHGLYQAATCRGFLTPEMIEATNRAKAKAKELVKNYNDAFRVDAKAFTQNRRDAFQASVQQGKDSLKQAS